MTSSIINFIAEKYLANIVEINPEQTKTSLWAGTFEMANLKIKKEIFESLNLPYFELVDGYIGNLKIEMSLPRFYLYPIKVAIDKVFFHAKQKSLDNLNKEEEEKSMERFKNGKLQSAEQFTTEVNKLQDETSSFLTNMINNVQVTINDICIRFDDDISCVSTPVSLGVLIKKIIIQTTTDKFEESEKPEQIPYAVINYKLVKISHLSIFLDIYENKQQMDYTKEIVHSDKTIEINEDLRKYLGKAAAFYQYGLSETMIKINDPNAHHYLLYDLVMNLQVAINENLSNGKPKIASKCVFDQLQMFLCLKQIKVIMRLLAYMNLNSLYELGIKKSYYVKTLSNEEKLEYMNNYIKYYKAKYHNDNGNPNSDEVNHLHHLLEVTQERLTYEKIQSMRDACLIKIRYINSIERIDKQIAELEKGSWNPFDYLMTTKEEKEKEMKELKMQKEELKLKADEINNELEKQLKTPMIIKEEPLKELKDNFVLYHVKLCIITIKMTLYETTASKRPLLVILQKQLEILADMRKAGQFFSLFIGDVIIRQEKLINTPYKNLFETIESIDDDLFDSSTNGDNDINSVKDKDNDKESQKTVLIYKEVNFKKIKPKDNNGALYIEFENCPHLPFSNYRLKLHNDKQFLITINLFSLKYSMNKILDALNTQISLDDIQNYTAGEVTKYVQEGYIENLLSGNYQHFNIDLDVLFKGPIILFPQNIIESSNHKCLLVRVGDLNIKSQLPPRQNLKNIDYIHLEDPKQMYDVYIFEAIHFNLSTLNDFDGSIAHLSKATRHNLIDDITFEITFSNIIEPKNVNLPKIDVQIIINSIRVNIRDTQLFFFIEFIDGYEKTMRYLQYQLKQSEIANSNNKGIPGQCEELNVIQLEDDAIAKEDLKIISDHSKKDNDNDDNKGGEDQIVQQKETIFLKMRLKLHSIKLLIKKSLSKEERDLVNDGDHFKTFLSFCMKQYDIDLSMTEKKNTKLLITLYTMCITDQETQYDIETKQLKLISNPAFISLISTRNTNMNDILNKDRRGQQLLLSLAKTSFQDELEQNIKSTPFISINYQYDSSTESSTVSLQMTNFKMNVNLSSIKRLYQFYQYFYEEYITMLNNHVEDEKNLTKEFQQFEEMNQMRASVLPKEGINQDFMQRLKRKTIQRKADSLGNNNPVNQLQPINPFKSVQINEAQSIMANSRKTTACIMEKGSFKISITISLKSIEFILPVHPEASNSKLLKFHFNLLSKTDLNDEFESFYSKHTHALVRMNYSKKNQRLSTKLFNIGFDVITYSNNKFRSNCLSEKILNNLRISFEWKRFLIIAKENNVSSMKLHIEPLAMMLGFREVKVFRTLLEEFQTFHYAMNHKYDDPIKTLQEEDQSIIFNYSRLENDIRNLMKNKTHLIKIKALKTIFHEEAKNISEEINQATRINLISFNNLMDITFNLERVTLRFMDNTQNYEAPVFHIELNQLQLRYITNSEPNDVSNMANAIVEAIGGKDIPMNNFNMYNLALYLNGSTNLAISYYNDRVNNWEPIIEPWSMTVQAIQVARFTRLKAEIISSSMLNFNLSLYSAVIVNSFMKKLNQNEEDWYQESKNASFNTEKGDDSAVEFSNISGSEIVFWLDCNTSMKYTLKSGDKRIFSKNDLIKANRSLTNAEAQLIKKDKFSFKLKGFCEIPNQDFSYSHFNNLMIYEEIIPNPNPNPNDNDKDNNANQYSNRRTIQMVIRIKSRGMVKSVLFESNISLFNNLSHPIVLIMINEGDYITKYQSNEVLINPLEEKSEVIIPNKKYVIPLCYIITPYRIYISIQEKHEPMPSMDHFLLFLGDFRFLHEYHYTMSSYINATHDSKPIIRDKVSRIIQLPYENRTHYLSIDFLVQKAKNDNIKSMIQQEEIQLHSKEIGGELVDVSYLKTFAYYVVFQEPLVIENLLPFPMKLSLNSNEGDSRDKIINAQEQENDESNSGSNEHFIRKDVTLNPLDALPLHLLDPSESETQVIATIPYNDSLYNSDKFFLFDKAIDKKRLIALRKQSDDQQKIFISIDIGKNDINLNMFNSSKLDLIKIFSHRMKLVFYVEYLVINKTSMILHGKEDNAKSSTNLQHQSINGKFHPQSINIFSIVSDKIVLRDSSSEWCKPFELKTFGMAGVCSLESKKGRYTHINEIAVLISSSEKFTNSTIITLEDRYLLISNLGASIFYRQFTDKKTSFPTNKITEDNEKQSLSFIRTSKKMKKCLQISFDSKQFSSPFCIDALDDCNIKIPIDDNIYEAFKGHLDFAGHLFQLNSKKFLLAKVTIYTIDNGLIYIVLHYPKYSDYKIRNEIDTPVQIYQKNDEFNKEYFDMKANEEVPYVWDDLLREDKSIICIVKGKAIEVSFDKIEVKTVFTQGKSYYVQVGLENDNMTRVIYIKEVLSSKEETAAMKILLGKKRPMNSKCYIIFKGVGISVIDEVPKEVLYISISGLVIKYCKNLYKTEKTTETTDNAIIAIRNLQIDYCLWDNSFKSLLMPKKQLLPYQHNDYNLNDTNNTNDNDDIDYDSYVPFLQILLSRRLTYNIELEQYTTTFPQADITMQEVNLFLDQKSLMSLLRLWKQLLNKMDFYQPKKEYIRLQTMIKGNSINEEISHCLPPEAYDNVLSTQTESAQYIISQTHFTNMLFINYLMISALKITFSLRVDLKEFGTDFGLPKCLYKIVLTIGNALGHITNAPLFFREMISKNVFTDWGKIIALLIKNYQRQVFEQIYTILGYSNLLGNPMGIMEKIGTGFREWKGEPRKNFVKGPTQRNEVISHQVINEEDVNDAGRQGVVGLLGKNIMEARRDAEDIDNNDIGNDSKEDNKENDNPNNAKDNQVSKPQGLIERKLLDEHEPLKDLSSQRNKGREEQVEHNTFLKKAQLNASIKSNVYINPIPLSMQVNHIPLGIRDQTKGYSRTKLKTNRFRFPRTIDSIKGLQPYDPIKAEIYAVLHSNWEHDDQYKIVYYKDMIYFEVGYDKQISTLILTDGNVIIAYNLNEIAFDIELSKLTKIEVHIADNYFIFLFIMKNNKKKCFKTNDLILCCELYSILYKIINNDDNKGKEINENK